MNPLMPRLLPKPLKTVYNDDIKLIIYMNKKVLISTAIVIAVLAVGTGATIWYLSTPSGKDMVLERQFNKVVASNLSDNFRQALPTVLPKNQPEEFEFFYENRDDEADYAESVLINANESYIKVATGGTIKTTPFTISSKSRAALYEALRTIPFDQIRVNSLPITIPKIDEIVIGNIEKPKTQQETLRVAFGKNQADRQNIMYVSGPSTEITDQSRPNWDIAKSLAISILDKFRPKK